MARLPNNIRAAIVHRITYFYPYFGPCWEWTPSAASAKDRARAIRKHYALLGHHAEPLIASVRVPNGSRASLCAWLNTAMPAPPRADTATARRDMPSATLEPSEPAPPFPDHPSDPSDIA